MNYEAHFDTGAVDDSSNVIEVASMDNKLRWRIARGVGVSVVALILLFLATFALPIPVWRTGELPVPPLPVERHGPEVSMTTRLWIDTDAACGHGRTTDPDDCFALMLLTATPGIEIVGVSTVFGNAPLDVTDPTAREVMAAAAPAGANDASVHRGAESALEASGRPKPRPAHLAIRHALEQAPLTFLALGPLTNLAAALQDRPDLEARVDRLVAVMGRRPGHLFHPAEGKGHGMLFGHGPVFRDFNFDMDRAAARSVLAMQLPTTLVPYDAGRDVIMTADDLAALAAGGRLGALLAGRAQPWLRFWQDEVGRRGFYPFDLLAGAYIRKPELFHCANALAWVSTDERLWNFWFYDPPAMLVGLPEEVPAGTVRTADVVYCADVDPGAHDEIMGWLTARGQGA